MRSLALPYSDRAAMACLLTATAVVCYLDMFGRHAYYEP